MRRHTPRFVTLASAAVLLFGCAEGHPLAPPSTADAARAAQTLAAPSAAVAVGVSESRIDLQWTDNSSGATSFEILRSTNGASGEFVLRATTGLNAVTYSDAWLQRRTQYCYSIRAVRRTGTKIEYSPPSNVTCASTGPFYVPLTAPSNVTAVAPSSAQVDVTWQDNSTEETRFEIYMTSSDGTYTNWYVVPANVQAFRFESLVPATEYCYRVRAVAEYTAGYGFDTEYSAYSNTACVLTPLGPPPQASSAVASPSGSTSVSVSWRTSVWPVGDSFRIDRSTDGGVVWQVAGTVPSVDNFPFKDEPLPSERSVCYRVVAYNSTAAAAPSNTSCTTPPAAPTEATLRRVETGVLELTWRDNSAVEEGYEVLITITDCGNIDGNGLWGCWTSEYLLGVLPAGSTRAALPDWGYPNLAGPVSVRAMKDGGYSDPAVVESVTP
jgi:hypothetical protein